jgi:type IV pilus assembly protein PilA
VHKLEQQEGFTLIEVLMVVGIIGILVSIMVPQYTAYRMRAFNSEAVADLKNLKTGFEAYKIEYEVYPESVAVF